MKTIGAAEFRKQCLALPTYPGPNSHDALA